jgi:hypothetical protein
VPKEVLDAAYAGPAQPRRRGETIWPGLLRRLDRIDPSYRMSARTEPFEIR